MAGDRASSVIESSVSMESAILGSTLRAVAYHAVPQSSMSSFSRQLDYFAKHYVPLDAEGFTQFLAQGSCQSFGMLENNGHYSANTTISNWQDRARHRPGLIISFDDGLIEQYEVAAPLLEARGMRGWFFVPSALLDLEQEFQQDFCALHDISLRRKEARKEKTQHSLVSNRIAMGLNEIKDLARRGHVIGCHTAHHVRMRPTLDAAIILKEIAEAKKELEMRLGDPVNAFAWVGGEPDTYRADALQMLCEAGFSWIFTTQSSLFRVGGDTRAIHRTVLEPDLPFPLFLAKINGLSDLMHCGRRKASLNAMRL